MNVIIIEDEIPAAEKLTKMIQVFSAEWKAVAVLRSVEDAVSWFRSNPLPDLVFFDIMLRDGLSLEIFNACDITCPVIFVTAYDQYLAEALSKYGIDYLLKPLRQEKLNASLRKLIRLQTHFTTSGRSAASEYFKLSGQQRQRLLVRKGKDLVSVRTTDAAYFYTENKLIFLVDRSGLRYLTDQTLSELEDILGKDFPGKYFRVNRQYLVHADSVKKLRILPKSRIEIELEPSSPNPVIVASETTASLKAWLNS